MLIYAIPFIPNMLAYSANSASDRCILKSYFGNAANGIYDTAYKIPNIVSILYPAFNLAWTESAAFNVNEEDSSRYYTRMFHMIFRLLSGGAACLLAISPYLFYILVAQQDKYGSAIHYIPTLVIAMYCLCFAQFFLVFILLKKRVKT